MLDCNDDRDDIGSLWTTTVPIETVYGGEYRRGRCIDVSPWLLRNKNFVRECLKPEFRSAVGASNWTYVDMCTSSAVKHRQQSSMCMENIRAQNIAIRHSELLTKMADGSVEGVELRDGIGICRSPVLVLHT